MGRNERPTRRPVDPNVILIGRQRILNIIGCLRCIRLGWVSCSLFPIIKSIPTHQNIFAVGKSSPNSILEPIFLGLGWHWVGELVGFVTIFSCFPTQRNLASRKHPNVVGHMLLHSFLRTTPAGNIKDVYTLIPVSNGLHIYVQSGAVVLS